MMLCRTVGLHLPYESRTPTSVPLVGQGWAQAASNWAFCLRVHRVGSSIGFVGSPPHQRPSPFTIDNEGAPRFEGLLEVTHSKGRHENLDMTSKVMKEAHDT